jgi:hypothetical protein
MTTGMVTLIGGMHNGRVMDVGEGTYQLDLANQVDGIVVTSTYKPDPADPARFLLDHEDRTPFREVSHT